MIHHLFMIDNMFWFCKTSGSFLSTIVELHMGTDYATMISNIIYFLDRGLLLTWKLLDQWFLVENSALQKSNAHHHDLLNHYGIVVLRTCLVCRSHNITLISSFMRHHRSFNKSNTTGVTSNVGTVYPSRLINFPHGLVRYTFGRSLTTYLFGVVGFVI